MVMAIFGILIGVAIEALVTTAFLIANYSHGGIAPIGIALIRFALSIGLAGVIEAIRIHTKRTEERIESAAKAIRLTLNSLESDKNA